MSDFPDLGEFSTPIGTNDTIDEIDFDRAASAFPDISLDGSGDIPSFPGNTGAPASLSNDFDFDTFATPSLERQGTEVKVTGDDEIEKFESEFPDIDIGQHISPPVTQFTPTPIDEEEPQVIKDWREKQREEIEAREAASRERRQDTISKAEGPLMNSTKTMHRRKRKILREQQEGEFIASQQAFLSTGTTWERICKIVELENSQSKTLARTGGTTDLTRFKEVLLRLKREGDMAPGAAGY
ncbi:clathrin light chain-domain-containing protein [Cyathus striatus]|nr:clathrin light chain-domain-containing protein [Cyathus striatus]